MRHASATSSTGPGGFICCLLGHEQYALYAADVRIVARAEQMRLETTEAGGCVGTLQHAGRAVPVYSLSALFGRSPDRSGLDRHIIVARGAGGNALGLLVDRMLRAPAGQPGQILPIPNAVGPVAAEWFHGLLTFGDELSCLVLSPAALDPRRSPESTRVAEGATAGRAVPGAHGHRPPAEIVATFTSAELPAIGVRRFALGAYRVAAVAQSLPSIAIPGAAGWISGLAWWREHAVPILSFNGESLAGRGSRSRRWLVVRTGGRFSGGFVAFEVNADIELHRATGNDAEPPIRPPADADFVIGIYLVGREPVALIDIDRLTAGGSGSWARRVSQVDIAEPLPLVV